MPGSSTTPGRSDLAMGRPKRVAFRARNSVGAQGLAFAAPRLASECLSPITGMLCLALSPARSTAARSASLPTRCSTYWRLALIQSPRQKVAKR